MTPAPPSTLVTDEQIAEDARMKALACVRNRLRQDDDYRRVWLPLLGQIERALVTLAELEAQVEEQAESIETLKQIIRLRNFREEEFDEFLADKRNGRLADEIPY